MAISRSASTKSKTSAPAAAKRAPSAKDARKGLRKARSVERRDAILAAALEEFSARGFEATRLDDVAARAKIAKGTIYLYFRDKETLFQELIRAMLTPLVGTLETLGAIDMPLAALSDVPCSFIISLIN